MTDQRDRERGAMSSIGLHNIAISLFSSVVFVSSDSDSDFWNRKYVKFGDNTPPPEQGTKVYEYQLDTGSRRDNRSDSELTYLELLDRNISRILMDPVKGQGHALLKYLKLFTSECQLLKKMMVDESVKVNKDLKESAIKVYHRYGHPRFMTVMVTNGGEYLQNTLGISDDLMWDFFQCRLKANELWDDIRAVMVRDYRSDRIEAERFRNLPWPKHLDNLTDFEKSVLEKSDIDIDEDLADMLNVKSTLF